MARIEYKASSSFAAGQREYGRARRELNESHINLIVNTGAYISNNGNVTQKFKYRILTRLIFSIKFVELGCDLENLDIKSACHACQTTTAYDDLKKKDTQILIQEHIFVKKKQKDVVNLLTPHLLHTLDGYITVLYILFYCVCFLRV